MKEFIKSFICLHLVDEHDLPIEDSDIDRNQALLHKTLYLLNKSVSDILETYEDITNLVYLPKNELPKAYKKKLPKIEQLKVQLLRLNLTIETINKILDFSPHNFYDHIHLDSNQGIHTDILNYSTSLLTQKVNLYNLGYSHILNHGDVTVCKRLSVGRLDLLRITTLNILSCFTQIVSNIFNSASIDTQKTNIYLLNVEFYSIYPIVEEPLLMTPENLKKYYDYIPVQN